jgi:prepilin-type N-terminal cleavage/methylation domain-containing protein
MKKGFTLVELLIVLVIVGILTLISFGALKIGGKSLALSRSAHALAVEIRKAQEMAIAMRKIKGDFPRAYGVYINKNPVKIYLFADTSPPYDRYTGGDERIEDFCKTERDICLGKVQITSLSPGINTLDIVFKPPYPSTIIDQDPSNSEAQIKLQNDAGTRIIKVYKSGLISIE